jgi:hypothetical protein
LQIEDCRLNSQVMWAAAHAEDHPMKQVIITGPRQVEMVDRPDPHAKGEYVVVKVHATPLCTEYKVYRDNQGRPVEFLGHEAAGEVVEVAPPGRVKVGDRVAVMPLAGCGKCPLCLGRRLHPLPAGPEPPQGVGQHGRRVHVRPVPGGAGLAAGADPRRRLVRPRRDGLLRPGADLRRDAEDECQCV